MKQKITFPDPEQIMPHDKPMSLVDRIVSFSSSEQVIQTQTAFSQDAFFYQGHFKGNPVTPGVILVEAMFQSCGLYLRLLESEDDQIPPILGRAVKIINAVFKKEVKPNETLLIKGNYKHRMMHFHTFEAVIEKDGEVVSQAQLVLS